MHSIFAVPLIALAALATPAFAKKAPPAPVELGQETSIPFVRTIGLYNFEADGNRGVWLQDRRRIWYYARISGLCIGLPYANRIGVDTRFGGGEFDRSGALLVDERCHVDSVVTSAGPPKKEKKPKKG